LIALFNKNAILWKIKYSFPIKNNNEFEKEVEENLQDEFFRFPRPEIKDNQALYDFLSLYSVHQKANECTKKILELTKTIEIIKSGGMSFNNNANEPSCKHINILMFALKNHIMIDQDVPYKSIMKDFVKISILRQSLKHIVKLNQYEFYSAIQFYLPKELKAELKVFVKNKDNDQLRLSASDECSEWMISTILPNLTGHLISKQSIFEGHEDRFVNCVRLLSFLDLKDTHVSKAMSEFFRLIASSSTTIGTYEAINEFLAHQYSLFERKIEIDVLISILNTMIDKINYKSAHAWDHHAIANGTLGNLYGYIGEVNGEYTDKERVYKLVNELKEYEPKEQREFSKSLLYSIFNISDFDVRGIIKEFIESVISQTKINAIDDLEFELWSVAVGFKDFESEVITKLDEYLKNLRESKSFSTQIYKLQHLTQYLIDEKQIDALVKVRNELSDLISQYRNLQHLSSI